MAKEKARDFHLNLIASEELNRQVARIGRTEDLLQELAEIRAVVDSDRSAALGDLLESRHIVSAADTLLHFVDQAREQLKSPATVFLSYSIKDLDFAGEISTDLKNAGMRPFLAALSIEAGAAWPEEIWQAIRGCRVFVLIATADALKSKWCLPEIGAAIALNKTVITALRHNAKLPDVLKSVQAIKVQTRAQQAALVSRVKQLCS